jgi:hypothetical protein
MPASSCTDRKQPRHPNLELLLDEMYSPALADALRAAGIEAVTVNGEGLAVRSDPEILAVAAEGGYAVLDRKCRRFRPHRHRADCRR